VANPNLPLFGYNSGAGTGHTHATPDLAGWQDTYQKIGLGATAAAAAGVPFATCTKLFDGGAGYPNFPTWAGIAPTLVANNGGVPLMPMFVFGSGPGPSTAPTPVSAMVTFFQGLPAGQRAAFNFISEPESGNDGLSPSQYVTNWIQNSTNLNAALHQMAVANPANASFWTRANFPFITASRMDYYGSAQAGDPQHQAWLPPLAHVDAYGADFYQHVGGTLSVGAQADTRYQTWLHAVYTKAGTTNVPLAFPEYGIGFNPGAYTAALEAARAALLQKDFQYVTGSSRPSGSAPFLFWEYWYQMDGGINIYCFPLAPTPGAGETQAQAIATIQNFQQIITFSQSGAGQNIVTVTNPGTQNSTAGQTANLPITASDSSPGLALTYTAAGLPPGLGINASSGLITGQMTASGTYQVTVTATDPTTAHGSATFTWVVNTSGTVTVTVTSPGNQVSTRNVALQLQIAAADSAGNPLTFSAAGLPAGLSISSSGLVTGTPSTLRAAAGVTVTALDSVASVSGSATFTWAVVASAVTIQPIPAQHNLTTDSVSLQVNAADSNPALTLSYAATGLPTGLAIAAGTGLITGTPGATAAGGTAVTITVTDTAGAHSSLTFVWTVTTTTGPTVTVVNPGNQGSTQFKAGVSLQMSATDSAGNAITFSATGLPSGLSISSSGLITGTPNTVQTTVVVVTGTDSASATGQATFTWAVVAPIVAITNPGNQSSILNEVISLQLTGTDTSGSGLTYTATGLPTGLSISLGGLISGTCTTAVGSPFSVVVTGHDSHSVTGTVSFTWTVAAVTVNVTNPGPQVNNVGDSVSLQMTAIDSSDNALTWSATGLPFPLVINPTTGLITGGPSTPGSHIVVVTATDSIASVSNTAGFIWTVDVSTPVLAISLSPAAGTDLYGNTYPAGVTVGPTAGPRTTIGLNGLLSYSTVRVTMPAMAHGWAVGNGHAKVQLDALGSLVISWKIMTVGTVTDGTLIWAVGSLPVGYRPATKRRIACYADAAATGKTPAVELAPDGSVACYGIGGTATRIELDLSAPILL
jgi:hypothetical protein